MGWPSVVFDYQVVIGPVEVGGDGALASEVAQVGGYYELVVAQERPESAAAKLLSEQELRCE